MVIQDVDLMVLKVYSNLNDSMILILESYEMSSCALLGDATAATAGLEQLMAFHPGASQEQAVEYY